MTPHIFDFSHLSADERIELAEQLWDSLEPAGVPAPSDAVRDELRRRRAEVEATGDLGEPWERALSEIADPLP